MPTAAWWEALWPAPHKIVTAVGISPDMEVVDLCSGDGWFTLQIAKRAHYVVAIDIEPKLLETARRQYFRVDDRLGLSDEEENALISFMQTLTDGFLQGGQQ
jgi:protein-L-isoaspartate O-methyltransferase